MNITKILLSFVIAMICSLTMSARVYQVSEVPNVQLADSTRLVSDPDNLIDDATEARLNSMLRSLRARTTVEAALVAITDIPDDTDVETYATELFTEWGIGKKSSDNGLLLLYVPQQRKLVARTGRGTEGPLPDVVLGRIMRETVVPAMKAGDVSGALTGAVRQIDEVLSNPDVADELRGSGGHDADEFDFFSWYLQCGVVTTVFLLVILIIVLIGNRRKSELERYRSLDSMRTYYLFFTVLFLGMPLLVYLYLLFRMRRIRLHRRDCPGCGHRMHRVDEDHDNDYLTSAQDAEERLNSIDYDVWLCDNCGRTETIPYVNKSTAYTQCPYCDARACSLSSNGVVIPPTVTREGLGIRGYTCRHCGRSYEKQYAIPKLPPPVIVSGGGRGGSSFGGGGSFGGGMTSGGGATGSW